MASVEIHGGPFRQILWHRIAYCSGYSGFAADPQTLFLSQTKPSGRLRTYAPINCFRVVLHDRQNQEVALRCRAGDHKL